MVLCVHAKIKKHILNLMLCYVALLLVSLQARMVFHLLSPILGRLNQRILEEHVHAGPALKSASECASVRYTGTLSRPPANID